MQKFEKKRGVLPNFSVIFAHRAQFFRQFFEFFRQIFSSGDGRRQTIEPDEKMKKFDEKNQKFDENDGKKHSFCCQNSA